MGTTYKPIGRAVATAKGHYPTGDGRHATITAGETFTVFEGLDKGKWFTLLPADAPAPAPVKAETPTESPPETLAGAAAVERKRRAAVRSPTADEIA